MHPETIDPSSINNSARQDRLRKYLGAGAGAVVLAGTVTTASSDIVFINYNNAVFSDTPPGDVTSTFFPFDINSDGIIDFRLRHRLDAGKLALPRCAIRLAEPSTLIGGSAVGASGTYISIHLVWVRGLIGPAATFITTHHGQLKRQHGSQRGEHKKKKEKHQQRKGGKRKKLKGRGKTARGRGEGGRSGRGGPLILGRIK